MLDPRLRLRHLRCFLETGRLGSLSAAAEALHVSLPAASKTIRELETILGVELFDRSARRLALTREGKTFQRYAGAAMVELDRGQSLVRAVKPEQIKLAVGALPTASTELLPIAALSFRESHPDCLIRVSTGPNWMLLSQLRDGTLDMVVGRMAQAQDMEGLLFRQLYSEKVLPIVRPGHPLCHPDWEPESLSDYPLLLPPSGTVIYPMVRAYLHHSGIGDPVPAFESVSLAFGRKVVQQSDTVWFISHGVVSSELNEGTLASLPLQDDVLGGPMGISMRDNTLMTPEMRDWVKTVIETAHASVKNSSQAHDR
ncbi:MAG: LysR family pca operon transcriptional activator [bacterium]